MHIYIYMYGGVDSVQTRRREPFRSIDAGAIASAVADARTTSVTSIR